jgi:probable rRNA maturation factor
LYHASARVVNVDDITGKLQHMSTSPPLHIFHDYQRLPAPRRELQRVARRLFDNEPKAEGMVNLVLCSDYRIRKLNAQFRAIDRPTDVLSFPFDEPDLLGEIYISLQRASVQARRYGSTYAQEVVRLFVHGFLHLVGHDHHEEAERERMEARERLYC